MSLRTLPCLIVGKVQLYLGGGGGVKVSPQIFKLGEGSQNKIT